MKKYICDITGKEVSYGNYVETVDYHMRPKHGYLHDFGIGGYDRELEPQLDELLVKSQEQSEKTRTLVIKAGLERLGR